MLTIEQAVETRKKAGVRTHTPWGASDGAPTVFAPGIVFYTTPSHGGFHLSVARLNELPEALRKHERGSGQQPDTSYCSAQWFEEDCEACLVVVGFPDHFTGDEREHALASLKAWYPRAYAAYVANQEAK